MHRPKRQGLGHNWRITATPAAGTVSRPAEIRRVWGRLSGSSIATAENSGQSATAVEPGSSHQWVGPDRPGKVPWGDPAAKAEGAALKAAKNLDYAAQMAKNANESKGWKVLHRRSKSTARS